MKKARIANKGWTVVMAGLAINLILGVLYAWGVIAKALGSDWHWTKTRRHAAVHRGHSLFCRDDGVRGAMPGQIRPAAGGHGRRHHAGPRLGRFGAGSFAHRDGVDLWRRRRVGDWSGLLGNHPAGHQMVSTRAQGRYHRHCGQRRGPGGGLYLSADPVPSGQNHHFDDFCLAGHWHAGSGAAAGAAFAKPAGTAGGAGVRHSNGGRSPARVGLAGNAAHRTVLPTLAADGALRLGGHDDHYAGGHDRKGAGELEVGDLCRSPRWRSSTLLAAFSPACFRTESDGPGR